VKRSTIAVNCKVVTVCCNISVSSIAYLQLFSVMFQPSHYVRDILVMPGLVLGVGLRLGIGTENSVISILFSVGANRNNIKVLG